MKSVKIEINDKLHSFDVPECFNELKPGMYEKIIQYFTSGKKAEHELLVLSALFGLFDEKLKMQKQIIKIFDKIVEQGEAESLFVLIKPFFEEQDFTVWIFKKLSLSKKEILCGPSDNFNEMNFKQYIAVDMLATAYFGSKSEVALNKLIAVMYDTDAEHISTLSENRKLCILYNYIGIRNWITKKYPLVYKSEDTSKRTNIQLGRQENSWLSVRRHLAGNDVLKLKKIDNINVHEAHRHLDAELRKE